MKLGLSEKQADWYLQFETDTNAVLPTFRLLKPLNDHLEFYKGEYCELIEKQYKNGSLAKDDPEIVELLQAGFSPKFIGQLVYKLTLIAYEALLYQLDDHEGPEFDEMYMDGSFDQCGYGKLIEIGPNGPTGRYLMSVHGMLPFSDL